MRYNTRAFMSFDIEVIKNDLRLLDKYQFYRRYIMDSSNWYFSEYRHRTIATPEDQLNDLKTIVSKSIGVSFESVYMVGSAKLGCSLSPGKKRFLPFGETSDIDIVVVSLKLFVHFWHRLLDEQRYRDRVIYRCIMPTVFKGYINEKPLSLLNKIGNEWHQRFSEAKKRLQNELEIIHRISFRVYRCKEDFERYHLKGIAYIKQEEGI